MNPEPTSAPGSAETRPWKRGFWALIVTQFQGAFSDNALKQLVIYLILTPAFSLAARHRTSELVGALFSLPFIVFSMAGGYLADRYSKRSICISVKIFEIGVMLFATAGLAWRNLPMQLAAVFLMGVHSAFFGPSKYGLLPELLPERELSWGNGILELGTFMAIILGLVAAGFMSDHLHAYPGLSGCILIGLAGLGLLTSLGISRVPPADPDRRFQPNFVKEVWRQVTEMRRDRPLFLAIIGNTYFNFLGALLLLNLVFYGADVLHVSDSQISFLDAALALGIGGGSFAAGYLSGGKIEYGLIPLGSIGLSIGSMALAWPNLSYAAALWRVGLLGFVGGFFIVPVSALLQHRPEKANKGGVLATANLLSFIGVLLASGAHYLLTQVWHMNPLAIFLAGGVMTVAGTIYLLVLLPDALLRLALWVATHTFYRIQVVGRENIPPRGGALFVCNHLSLVDALLLQASTDRPIRFIMYQPLYERPWIKPFARILKAIPISSEQRPRDLILSLRTASEAVRNGEIVCIFAEGQVTRIGQLLPFRRGFEKIMKDLEAPIIPVSLDGVWGSIFSFDQGRFLWKWPEQIPYPVAVSYGRPLPPQATPIAVRDAVQTLGADLWRYRRHRMLPLHRGFLRSARRHPFRFAMADGRVARLSFAAALTRTLFVAQRLRPIWQDQEMVGILLPPSVAGALANLAALFLGKVPVNLNYTASEATLASCLQQCRITTVLSTQAFLDELKLKLPARVHLVEEAFARPRPGERLAAWLRAWLLPAGVIERQLGRAKPASLDDLATVIFSSGSTGDPKGVLLSHFNIVSNLDQLSQTFPMRGRDRLLGALPFFHSFGFTGTLCLPAVRGAGVVYHPNPLDAKRIGELTQRYAVTFLLATPTFLQIYLRGCAPSQFGGVHTVLVGAEKLPDRLTAAFEENFGIRPLEAYGCTECAPAVAVNTHDFRAAGFHQVGAKRGKIGHPLPGISIRIVDPDTQQDLPLGQAGLLLVRGPNVMQGYLGRPDLTAAVLRDGWYTTGDVATLDEDGFLEITDRLSRFSKIGGEMVPQIKVEERLHELAGVSEHTFVVTGVADAKKGERLIVLHKLPRDQFENFVQRLPQAGLPNLWIPRPNQFFFVPTFPLLGSGKLDLRRVRELAIQLAAATP